MTGLMRPRSTQDGGAAGDKGLWVGTRVNLTIENEKLIITG